MCPNTGRTKVHVLVRPHGIFELENGAVAEKRWCDDAKLTLGLETQYCRCKHSSVHPRYEV